jgi:hypothetical protein
MPTVVIILGRLAAGIEKLLGHKVYDSAMSSSTAVS